jgi:hypothetical protein
MRRANHCIERLRRAFTCWADVTPILFEIEPNGEVSIDLETLHYCRNFDNILAWTNEKSTQVQGDEHGWWSL